MNSIREYETDGSAMIYVTHGVMRLSPQAGKISNRLRHSRYWLVMASIAQTWVSVNTTPVILSYSGVLRLLLSFSQS
jgi:hypothetical protein